MSDIADLKCACVNCGGRIAFPAGAAGSTINCPHCSKPTLLQAPVPAASESLKCPCQHCGGRIAFPPHAVGATIKCPHCAKDTVLTAPGVPVAVAPVAAAPVAVPPPAPGPKPVAVAQPHVPTPPPPPPPRKAISISKPGAPAAAHGAPPPPPPAAPGKPGTPPPPPAAAPAAAPATEAPAEGKKAKEKPQFMNCAACGTEMSIKAKQCPACGAPVPQSKMKWVAIGLAAALVLGVGGFFLMHKGGGKSGGSSLGSSKDDLQLVKYDLTKIPGTTLMHVAGVLKNNTDHEVLSLQIDFKLFDKTGKAIGTASDFIMSLGPKTEWPFKAQVLDTDAVKAELVKINYQGK